MAVLGIDNKYHMANANIIDSGFLQVHAPLKQSNSSEPLGSTDESLQILTLEEQGLVQAVDPSKTGNKPKRLVAVEVYGYEVGRGKNKRVVTPDDVYKLSAIGSTDREIARWFDMDENTLKYNFSSIIAKGREDLHQSLRLAQIKLALSGNATMLIWLGKNILEQSDNPTNTEANQPLPWNEEDL